MSTLDDLVKRLLIDARVDVAAWLLGSDVESVDPLTVELPAGERINADMVFQVQLADGRRGILHIEVQGRRTHRPMPWRMLDYMSRLASTYPGFFHSVVLYQERGAGSDDTGRHQVVAPDGTPSLMWSYSVVHLWQMRAEDILQLGRRRLLPLVGLTQIVRPLATVQTVVGEILEDPDREQQARLLDQFLSLLQDEEIIAMLEKILSAEDLEELKRFPWRYRVMQEAVQDGLLKQLRKDVLQVIVVRFSPPADERLAIQEALAALDDPEFLEDLHRQAVVAPDIATFKAQLPSQPRE
jgi:hypothetical protein